MGLKNNQSLRKPFQGKKAQEEIVGFVVIIILTAIILLIFFAFSVDKPQQDNKDDQVENFLSAIGYYTTDCEGNQGPYSILKLISKCNQDESCLDGRPTCEVLNKTMAEILEVSFSVNENSYYKGYEFEIIQSKDTLISIKKGNITEFWSGNPLLLPNSIKMNLKLYS